MNWKCNISCFLPYKQSQETKAKISSSNGYDIDLRMVLNQFDFSTFGCILCQISFFLSSGNNFMFNLRTVIGLSLEAGGW